MKKIQKQKKNQRIQVSILGPLGYEPNALNLCANSLLYEIPKFVFHQVYLMKSRNFNFIQYKVNIRSKIHLIGRYVSLSNISTCSIYRSINRKINDSYNYNVELKIYHHASLAQGQSIRLVSERSLVQIRHEAAFQKNNNHFQYQK